MIYYLYTYTVRHRKDSNITYLPGVWAGDLPDLIKYLKENQTKDKYYDDFNLVFLKEINKEEYKQISQVLYNYD